MSAPELLLGIDLGTSSVKAVLIDQECRTVASASADYPTYHPKPGYAEQRPADWWDATCQAVRQAVSQTDGEVIAIGLSGQMHGTVLVHGDSESGIHSSDNAIIWQDRRSAPQAEAITREVGAERLISLAGSPIAAGFQAATLRWLAENEAERLAKAQKALLPKDWLRWRMTGEFATDHSDAAGTLLLGMASYSWSEPLLEAAHVRPDLLPDILFSTQIGGWLSESAALDLGLPEDTPVVVGAADTPCAMLGSGVVEETTMLLNLSTGGQLCLPVEWARVDAKGRIHTFRSASGTETGAEWYQMGATLSAGMALRWLRDQALHSTLAYADLLKLAADVPTGADGLLFLPYLVGERTPHMDASARAAFLGLSDRHDQRHLVRAVIEGATFASYDAYLALLEVAYAPQRIVLAGGGARSPLWRQIVADIFGMEVVPLGAVEQSALGAALLAGQGVGWWKAREQALACAPWEDPIHPNPEAHQRYMELHLFFQQAYQANRSLFHQLGAFTSKSSAL